MADIIELEKIDSVYSKIIAEDGLIMELKEYLSFYTDNYQWDKRYKKGWWNGKKSLVDRRGNKVYTGLAKEIEKFCNDRGYAFVPPKDYGGHELSVNEAKDFIKSLDLSNNIELRDYQAKAFIQCVRGNRRTVLSPTASGKSLIIYFLTRFYSGRKLIITNRTNLVDQMATDFHDYGSKQKIHRIYAGQSHEPEEVTITTWHSVVKKPKEWFDFFNVVIVDEVHGADAPSLISIIERTGNIQYKFGFTGTLKDLKVHWMIIVGLFGPVIRTEKTTELQKKGYVSPLKVEIMVLRYTTKDRKVVYQIPKNPQRPAEKYQKEIEWLCNHQGRNRFIKNLALSLKKNSMILFERVDKHGIPLYNTIKSESDFPVHFVAGKVPRKDREKIRSIVESNEKSTTVASAGVFSTGVNIKRLHNIISAFSTKSIIRLLQSIGRGLRKAEDKSHCTWYDVVDDLSYRGEQNYSLRHLQERIKIYAREDFEYEIHYIDLKE